MLSIFLTLFFTLLFIQHSVTPTAAVDTIYCGGPNDSSFINASVGYVKLRSKGYPKNVINADVNCILHLTSNADRIWVGFISGKSSKLLMSSGSTHTVFDYFNAYKLPYSYLSTEMRLAAHFGINSNTTWTGYDAVVQLSTASQQCPFADLLVHLEDDLVIPFASAFDNIENCWIYGNCPVTNGKNCNFEFTVATGKMLKLVWRYAHLDRSDAMTLTRTENGKNVSESIGKARVVFGQDLVQYFTGSYFNFQYSAFNSSSDLAFFVYVSAVDAQPNGTFTKCDPLIPSSKPQVWTNLDLIDGYSKNQQMCNSLAVSKTQEVSVNAYDLLVETCCDGVYIGETTNLAAATKLANPKLGYYSVRNVADLKFMWASDDSVQGTGFSVNYQIHDCTCAPQHVKIPCNDSIFVTPILNDNYYCSGMKCNFTVTQDDACPEKYIYVSFNTAFLSSSDNLVLYQDNNKIVTIKYPQPFSHLDDHHQFYLAPQHPLQLTFEAVDYSSNMLVNGFQHLMEMFLNLDPKPLIQKYVLTENNPSATFEMRQLYGKSGITVCSPNNVLDMFISAALDSEEWHDYKVFDADDLYNYVTDFSDITNLPHDNTSNVAQKITSTSGCFTVFSFNLHQASTHVVFFRIKDLQSKNCQNNNVFNGIGAVTVSASADGPCNAVILLNEYPTIVIETMATTSNTPVTVYPTVYSNRTLFAFDSSTASSYSNNGFYSPAIGFKIPANESITASFSYGDMLRLAPNKSGVLASPDYCGIAFVPFVYYANPLYFVEFYNTSLINITATYLNKGVVTITSRSQKHVLTQGIQYTVSTSYFGVNYDMYEATNTSGFLLHFESAEIQRHNGCSRHGLANGSLAFGFISFILFLVKPDV